jgi:two-component system, LytTR family, response regulator AlgR
MTQLTALIVDDEELARKRMRTLLGDCKQPTCSVAGEAGDAMQAMSVLRTTASDVVLLDIHMPGADGMQLARELRSLRPELGIIFVTAHAEHAVAAFDIDVVDYLTKPVRLERLEKALSKALHKKELLTSTAQGLQGDLVQEAVLIQDRGRTERVPLNDVLYFKAELKYVTVRTAQKSYILDGALNELEARYGAQFLRIHRNALVAKQAMRALERHSERAADRDLEDGAADGADIEGWAVRLHGVDDALQVSRRQLTAVRTAIAGESRG